MNDWLVVEPKHWLTTELFEIRHVYNGLREREISVMTTFIPFGGDRGRPRPGAGAGGLRDIGAFLRGGGKAKRRL